MSYGNVGYGSVTYSGGTQMAKPTDAQIEEKRAIIAEAREQALQAKADIIRVKARNKAENIRKKADGKAKMAIAKGEARAAKIEGITPAEIERKIRLDVHGRPKPAMRGWIHGRGRPPGIGGRHRADLSGTRYRFEVGLRRVHDVFAGIVRQFRLPPFGRLSPQRYRRATTHRPYEYLPANRRNLYAGLLCTRTILAQFNHRRHVDLHYRGAHHSRHLDQCPTLALRDCVYYFRRFRRGIHGIVLDFTIRRPGGCGAVGRRWRLLHRRSHRIRAT